MRAAGEYGSGAELGVLFGSFEMDKVLTPRQDIENFVRDGVVNPSLVHEEMTHDKLNHLSLEDIDTRYRKFVFADVIDGCNAVSSRFEAMERVHHLVSKNPHGFIDPAATKGALFEMEMFWLQAVLYLKGTLPTLDEYIFNGARSPSGASLGGEAEDEKKLRRLMENTLHKLIARYNVRQSLLDRFNLAATLDKPYMHFDVDLPAFNDRAAVCDDYWRSLGTLKEQFEKSAEIELNTVRLVFYRAHSLMDLYRRDLIRPEHHGFVFEEIESYKHHVRQCASRVDALQTWMGRCDRLADYALD